MSPARAIDTLRLNDLVTLLSVARRQSISAAARELSVTPSQVSKAMSRLERQLHVTLFKRGSRGITMTDGYRRIAPRIEAIVDGWNQLRGQDETGHPEFSMAAPSYLSLRFFPAIASSLPGVRIRALEMPPALVRALASEGFFDIALTVGAERLPSSWVSVRAGEIRKALFATPALARRLGSQPVDPDRLTGIPFVSPVYNANGRLQPVDEGCPLRRGERVLGHEVETIGLALELAARTGQLVFGPTIAATPLVRAGALTEVDVRDWNVTDSLYLACNGDRVMQRTQRTILAAIRAALSE